MQRAYATSTRVLSGLILVAGVAMIVSTLARGGGVLSLGLVLGVAFVLVGAARLWLAGQVRLGGDEE